MICVLVILQIRVRWFPGTDQRHLVRPGNAARNSQPSRILDFPNTGSDVTGTRTTFDVTNRASVLYSNGQRLWPRSRGINLRKFPVYSKVLSSFTVQNDQSRIWSPLIQTRSLQNEAAARRPTGMNINIQVKRHKSSDGATRHLDLSVNTGSRHTGGIGVDQLPRFMDGSHKNGAVSGGWDNRRMRGPVQKQLVRRQHKFPAISTLRPDTVPQIKPELYRERNMPISTAEMERVAGSDLQKGISVSSTSPATHVLSSPRSTQKLTTSEDTHGLSSPRVTDSTMHDTQMLPTSADRQILMTSVGKVPTTVRQARTKAVQYVDNQSSILQVAPPRGSSETSSTFTTTTYGSLTTHQGRNTNLVNAGTKDNNKNMQHKTPLGRRNSNNTPNSEPTRTDAGSAFVTNKRKNQAFVTEEPDISDAHDGSNTLDHTDTPDLPETSMTD